jgi:hypothetical protein
MLWSRHESFPSVVLRLVAGLKAEAVIAGFEDVAVMVRRSSKAVVILASPNMVAHSLKLRLVVIATLVHS